MYTKQQEDIAWEELEVGDFVLIKKGEMSPADILILDCHDLKCAINTRILDGISDLTFKSPINCTKVLKNAREKGLFNQFLLTFSGKIEFDNPVSDLTKFYGFIKLKKDPKGESISIDNIILRGSLLT